MSRGSVSACLQILDGAEEAIDRYVTVRVMVEEEETNGKWANGMCSCVNKERVDGVTWYMISKLLEWNLYVWLHGEK